MRGREKAFYLLLGVCVTAAIGWQQNDWRPYPNNPGVLAFASFWESVTPSDTVNFEKRPRALYFNSAGTIAAVDGDGNVESFTAEAGARLDIGPVRINDTGTDDGIDLIAIR